MSCAAVKYRVGVVGEEHCAGRRIRLAAACMLIGPRAKDRVFVGITLELVATQHPEPRDDIEGLVIPFAQSRLSPLAGGGRWRQGLTCVPRVSPARSTSL